MLHPLTPLLPAEILRARKILLASVPLPPKTPLHYKAITLLEPEKPSLLEKAPDTAPLPRKAEIIYYIRNTDHLFESIINLTTGSLESNVRVASGCHAAADAPEIMKMERIALADAGVQAELKKLELPEGSRVVSDPWIYGSDGMDDERRMFQCYLYLQHPEEGEDANYYGLPLPISPVVDVVTEKVIRIDYLPTGKGFKAETPGKYKLPPPCSYLPEEQDLRTDLKPLHIVQPEGASFTVTEDEQGSGGAVIEWQKWNIRTSFNYREGLVLHNVTYDGEPLLHRVTLLSDMSIPYADPRPPYHRKQAFDLGDAGAGVMANDLKLGCDCLGSIYYLSSHIASESGEPEEKSNCVCIHEQDAGIGFKHMNARTGRAVTTRARELVLQTIVTVSNYDYILAYIFTQSADLIFEVKATGILSTSPSDVDVPWGTIVHPGCMGVHHQHFFSLRLDPNLAGTENTVTYTEAHPLPVDDANPFSVGYTTTTTPITNAGSFSLSPSANRTFGITSTQKNPINRLPRGYRLQIPPNQGILAGPTSYHRRRAEFAVQDKQVWVTKHRERELYVGGRWTNQSRGGEGVDSFVRNGEQLDGEPVLWVGFGINHVVRIEDFPVMPTETMRVAMRPWNFFEKNPGLDVPPSSQEVNRSVLLSKEGESCCCVNGV